MQDPYNSGAASGAAVDPSPADRPPQPATSASAPVDQARAIAGEAGQTASSLAGQARQRLAGTLDGQKGAAADLVEQLAQSVQRSGEQFEGRQDWIASAVGRGAAELDALAGSIRDADLGELMGEVADFARRQPALFMGAALAAGFALARLGKMVAGDLSRDDLPTVPEVRHGQH